MKIGDALYDLWDGNWDGNGFPDVVRVWPVVKITERYVYVTGPGSRREGRTFRFDRAELETQGSAYSRSARELLYVRPGLDWPMAVISVSTPQAKAVCA